MEDRSHRLSGFASGVDWRLVTFKEPLPPASVCNFCGLVPSSVASLPCGHFLCLACVESCAGDNGQCSCTLDGAPFEKDKDVSWKQTSRDDLAKLKVSCWNREHGCDFLGPLGELLEHFEQLCDFHAASCPRCQDTIPRKELPGHYSARCSTGPSHERSVQEPAVEPQSTAGRLALPTDFYHHALASIQSGTKELAEVLAGHHAKLQQGERRDESAQGRSQIAEATQNSGDGPLDGGPLRDKTESSGALLPSTHETTSAVTKTSIRVQQRFETQQGTQGAHGKDSNFGNEEQIVWTVTYKPDKDMWYSTLIEPLRCPEYSELRMVCKVSKEAHMIVVYAESANPEECELISVTCLRSEEVVNSPSFWINSTASTEVPLALPRLKYICRGCPHVQRHGLERTVGFLVKVVRHRTSVV